MKELLLCLALPFFLIVVMMTFGLFYKSAQERRIDRLQKDILEARLKKELLRAQGREDELV